MWQFLYMWIWVLIYRVTFPKDIWYNIILAWFLILKLIRQFNTSKDSNSFRNRQKPEKYRWICCCRHKWNEKQNQEFFWFGANLFVNYLLLSPSLSKNKPNERQWSPIKICEDFPVGCLLLKNIAFLIESSKDRSVL